MLQRNKGRVVLIMSRTRAYRKEIRNKKIKQRKNKIMQLLHYRCLLTDKERQIIFKNKSGYLKKCHYNLISGGIKTKAKNMYTGKHHKGVYGKAVLYSRHDKGQIAHITNELEDYKNEVI